MAEVLDFDAARIDAVIARFSGLPGAMLPMLHALQEALGCVPEQAVPRIAHALNLSRAEVHGVVTFYHDYRRLPPGRHVVKLCQAEACQAMGSRELTRHAERALGVTLGATTPDGRVTLEPTYCLGLCATAPSAMVNGKLMGRASAARLDRALGALA